MNIEKAFRQYQEQQMVARVPGTVEQARVNPTLWNILVSVAHDTDGPDSAYIVALREELQKAIYAIHPRQ